MPVIQILSPPANGVAESLCELEFDGVVFWGYMIHVTELRGAIVSVTGRQLPDRLIEAREAVDRSGHAHSDHTKLRIGKTIIV